MDEIFVKKIRAAAVAGWWTFAIGYCLVLFSWIGYLFIMTKQPEGMLCLFGKGATWAEVGTIWMWGIVAYKLVVATMLFIVIWLTIWAKQLAKK